MRRFLTLAPTARGKPAPRLAFAAGRLMVLDGKGELSTWDVPTRRPVYKISLGDDRGPRYSAISPDGQVAAGVGDGGLSVQLVDAATGRALGKLATLGRVMFIAFSFDGRTIAATSDDQTTRIWDVATLGLSAKSQRAGRRPMKLPSQVVVDGSRWPITRVLSSLRFTAAKRRGLRSPKIRATSAVSRFRPTGSFWQPVISMAGFTSKT